MTIYLDLDDTVIHSIYGVGRNPSKRTTISLSNEDVYHTLLRPLAPNILAGLRNIGSVKILTTAVKEYALAQNRVFSLGFYDTDIISREDYITSINDMFGEKWVPLHSRTDPNSILIDNLPPTSESSRLKIQFLGIQQSSYFQIREFFGKEPDCFQQEVKDLLAKVSQQFET